jgi:DNA-directed RNA polymerase specialized sigma24 family protein
MVEHTDLSRIRSALRGEASAIASLVDDLTPVVQRRVARALLKSGRSRPAELRPEIEDMCQEVLSQLFADDGRLLRSWQPERGLPLPAFVGLIAQRQVLSLLRSRKRSPFSTTPMDPTAIEGHARGHGSDTQHQSEARQHLVLLSLGLQERLSPAGLEMFYRLYVWDQSAEEVSHETGQSVEAIYQWRSRIRKAALDVERELGAEPTALPRARQPESTT